ncbi:glycosyltransferase [Beijerinckia sp. L45]|uniref:glycosyltransferase n=1 Tax=Beijerinckia sp. L45 TaxID=1641855 RepID=UPI0034CE733B
MARPLYSPDPRRVGSNVIEFGFVTDDDLAALFRHALCLAFPSRTEGFGIPSLEAMMHGCPIITADCASMPEVCGDAALYAPADDFALWLDRIAALHANPDLGGASAPRERNATPVSRGQTVRKPTSTSRCRSRGACRATGPFSR